MHCEQTNRQTLFFMSIDTNSTELFHREKTQDKSFAIKNVTPFYWDPVIQVRGKSQSSTLEHRSAHQTMQVKLLFYFYGLYHAYPPN